DLVHRAAVKVDEKGTEAAAATAMVFEATGALAEPLPITVDRSFIFAVHDVSTGAPLFLGQVIDPTA
ncbi:MAG TPA: serpin family protein, partial [Nakamurella sp.]